VRPNDDAIAAIAEADVIILGPGSLYTSVLPNLIIKGILDAVLASPAFKIYVCNVMTQMGETEGFTASEHVRVLVKHTDKGVMMPLSSMRPRFLRQMLWIVTDMKFISRLPDADEIRTMGYRFPQRILWD